MSEQNTTHESANDLLTRREVATWLRVSIDRLARWAVEGGGPNFFKLSPGQSGQTRYRRRDVEAWMAARDCNAVSGRG